MERPTLRTARLELIRLDDDHLEFEVELDSDPEVLRYLDGRALTRAEVQQAHQRRLRAGEKIPGLGFWVGFHAERSSASGCFSRLTALTSDRSQARPISATA